MAARFHVNASGVAGPCGAQEGNCPFGADAPHFNTAEEARAAYEVFMGSATFAPAPKKASRTVVPSMPTPVMESVVLTVDAGKVRVGDEINHRGVHHPVRGSKIGYKYNAVTVPDLKKGERQINLPLDSRVEVKRNVETPESVAKRDAVQMEILMMRSAENYRPIASFQLSRIEELISSGSAPLGSHLDGLVRAQASDQVMRDYENEVRVAVAAGEELPYSAAYEKLKERYQDEIMVSSALQREALSMDARAEISARASFVKMGLPQ